MDTGTRMLVATASHGVALRHAALVVDIFGGTVRPGKRPAVEGGGQRSEEAVPGCAESSLAAKPAAKPAARGQKGGGVVPKRREQRRGLFSALLWHGGPPPLHTGKT